MISNARHATKGNIKFTTEGGADMGLDKAQSLGMDFGGLDLHEPLCILG